MNAREKVTFFLACWGAVVSTIVFLWDIYKWRNAIPKLSLSVSATMKLVTGGITQDENFVMVKVTNIGQRKTTLTTLSLALYKSKLKKFFNKPVQLFVIPTPYSGTLPHVLDAGEQWTGLFIRDPNIEMMACNGFLYCDVHHSLGKKPTSSRIILRPEDIVAKE